ncbi:polysaccharide deacetylase family protein [Psychrobium sp. 1_MG-2023]|uniref:polysaccharide deacetylase family protein n=1 Tax=Psychrobium sp. 1_MG-2023 TaxID=3062624 RepID=UPI000C345D89|nr:polysaccharide deacetylase family protein [Psychrobium sp. 1_MG-2023]MDP2559549.1 polysaccharide deacetylase family protein [Psychrobium sp. 1_MG-2023]PKF59387.1 polysaccharide deacetylase [Alteromonadales bacterium alter-6D02]
MGGLHRLFQGVGSLFSSNRLSILIYHQVLEREDPFRSDLPTAFLFKQQMALIKQYFTPLGLDEALELLAKKKLPANSIVVTFDDGYVNNLQIAAPILKSLNIPATVFVATAFTDGENMWNDNIIDLIAFDGICEFDFSSIGLGVHQVSNQQQRLSLINSTLEALKYVPYQERASRVKEIMMAHQFENASSKMMNWAQLEQLNEYGVSIGAHTDEHPILAVLESEQQQQQIERNIEKLSQLPYVRSPLLFAYPNGRFGEDYNDQTMSLLSKLAIPFAVTTHAGVSSPTTDPLQLPRYTPWHKSLWKFHMQLLLNTFNVHR